ncbi:MAG: nitroreductase/quinone reductase family protein [Mycobacterium sp.]
MESDDSEADHVLSRDYAISDDYRDTITDINLRNAEILRNSGVLAEDPFLKDFYCVVLHTVGAKSGVKRLTVVACLPDPLVREDDRTQRIFLFASYAGAGVRPAWYHNIIARPDQLAVEFNKEYFDVEAVELHGALRDEVYDMMASQHENFRQYAEANDAWGKSPIPVVALIPKDPQRTFHIPNLAAVKNP